MTRERQSQLRRWGIFNLVGVLGFVVQIAAIFLLKRYAGSGYLAATAIAVEIAVLHNFIWHEHLTWADVISPFRPGVLNRLLRFHLTNGLISIAGNIALTWAFVETLRCPYLPANVAGVLICSLLNFVAGNRFVFRNEFSSVGHGTAQAHRAYDPSHLNPNGT